MRPTSLSSLFRPALRDIVPYRIADGRGKIKLDAMENPFSLPESALEKIAQVVKECAFNRYPEGYPDDLRISLIEAGLAHQDYPLLFGNGSDEIIAMVHAALREGSVVMALDPSFSMYELNAKTNSLRFVKVPLNDDFSINEARTIQAIAQESPAVIWLAYPNNPTGNIFDTATVRAIIEAHQGLTIIDEAYLPFTGGQTLIAEMAHNERVAILRTLSKLGLAGLRLGYLMGHDALIQELNKIRLPFNTNRLSVAVAQLVLREYHPHLIEQATQIAQEREKMFHFLTDWGRRHPTVCAKVFPSHANFLLFRCGCAEVLYQWLWQKDIMIKNVSHASALLHNCLRFTLGAPWENEKVCDAINSFNPEECA